METTVLTYKLLQEWMDGHKVNMPLPLDKNIVEAVSEFPAVFNNDATQSTKLTTGSEEMVQVVLVVHYKGRDMQLYYRMNGLKFPVVMIVVVSHATKNADYPNTTSDSNVIAALEARNGSIEKFNAFDKSESSQLKLNQIMYRIKDALDTGTVGSGTRAWDEQMVKELRVSKNVSNMLLGLDDAVTKTTNAAKKRNRSGALAQVRKYTVPDNDVTLDVSSSTDANPTTTTTATSKATSSAADDEPISKKNEPALTAMSDGFTTFFKHACGTQAMGLYMMFVKMPEPFPARSTQKHVEAYAKCLTPMAMAAYGRVDLTIREASRGAMTMNTVFILGMSNPIFIAAATLCGVYIRDARLSDPNRGTISRFTEPNREVAILNAKEVLAIAVHKHLGIFQ